MIAGTAESSETIPVQFLLPVVGEVLVFAGALLTLQAQKEAGRHATTEEDLDALPLHSVEQRPDNSYSPPPHNTTHPSVIGFPFHASAFLNICAIS